MKKLALAVIIIAVLPSAAFAQKTINQLSAGGALGGTEQLPMFQTANPAVTTTPNALKTFVGTNLTVTGSFTATGLVTNGDLANSSMTLAGHSVALGGTQAFSCTDLSNGATGCSTATGTSGATIPLLNAANTWSGVQTITNSDIALLGSSTGKTTFTSANASASNFTLTIPSGSGTIAEIDVTDQTITGGANVTSLSQSTGNITVDCGARPTQYIVNGGAFTITAPANDGNCILDVENNASAGAVTLSGFSPNTIGGATLDTTNGHNFRLFVTRVHAHSSIYAVALQ